MTYPRTSRALKLASKQKTGERKYVYSTFYFSRFKNGKYAFVDIAITTIDKLIKLNLVSKYRFKLDPLLIL